MNSLWKRTSSSSLILGRPWAKDACSRAARSAVFLKKIQNGRRRVTLECFRWVRWRRSFRAFEGSRRRRGKTEYSSESGDFKRHWYWRVVFTHTYCKQIYLATLVTMQNCPKLLRNVTFVVQIAYFCIRPNKRREKEKKVFAFFVATFEQLVIKSNFLAFFGATFAQLFGKSPATCGKP